MAVSIALGAMLRQGKLDPGAHLQKGEAEGMSREGAVRFSTYQVLPFLSPFSKS